MSVINPILNILVMPTYSPYTLAIGDYSQYPIGFTPNSPTVEISAAGFPTKSVSFVPNNLNIYNASNLGICDASASEPLPDGIYTIKYSIAPAYQYFVEKTIMRVDNIMERFDTAFMKLDMFECDQQIKRQQKIDLDSVNYFIQCSIAAANKCANAKAIELYNQADKMLKKINKNEW
jgi:hypothetical protein